MGLRLCFKEERWPVALTYIALGTDIDNINEFEGAGDIAQGHGNNYRVLLWRRPDIKRIQ